MEAQAGLEWSEIAKSAYQAYAASTGNKNFRGDPMPEFDDLPVAIRTAWEAAARHVGDCLASSRSVTPDPSRWAGWLPPRDVNEKLPEARELTQDCKPGDRVRWSTFGGGPFEGTLKEWDNGTAIVLTDSGAEMAVRCV